MSEPARNHLVGFVLNALDHAETAQVEEALANQHGLHDDLQRIRAHLPTLAFDRAYHEPPPGLAARTCDWLAKKLNDLQHSRPDWPTDQPTDQPDGLAFFAAPLIASQDAAPPSPMDAVLDQWQADANPTESRVTESRVTESRVTESRASESRATESSATESRATELARRPRQGETQGEPRQDGPQGAGPPAFLTQTLAGVTSESLTAAPPPHCQAPTANSPMASPAASVRAATSPTSRATAAFVPDGAAGAWGGWRFRVADAMMALGSLVCASFLFVPALSHCRFASQTQACQNNLRQIGTALTSYSDYHAGFFPAVPLRGNRAFAGVIGVMLRDSEFLSSPAALFCVAAQRRTEATLAQFPTLVQIDNSPAALLPALRQAARGDYGFSVGYWERGKLALLRNQHRPWYAIAADAPSDLLPSHATANHAGKGQSVLFEDGHYQFLRRCCPRMSRDELFLNHFGHVSPGVDANDSVILAGDVPLESLQPES